VKWTEKNESTKTVIFEMHNKKEGHIIRYRSLAFNICNGNREIKKIDAG
jgi:hypothetical protein